jgi:signal transduction histidine kinase
MVEYSKVLGDDSALTVEPFELPALFDELMQASHGATEAKGLKFSGHIDPALGIVTSNRLKVKQVAYNLLSNAIKYTASGEVALAMLAAGEGLWKLRVSDTGVGIGASDRDRVFKEFERANDDDVPGAGLGLAIVKELCRMLDGELRFDSQRGVGTTFEITFPMQLPSAGTADAQKF